MGTGKVEKILKEKWNIIENEVAVIAAVILAFLTSACIGKAKEMHSHLFLYILVVALDIVFCAYVFYQWKKKFHINKGNKRKFLYDNRGLLLTLGFVFLSRIVQYGDKPKWDALIYYRWLVNGCADFNFSLRSFIGSFTMASHPTLGFAGIMSIGEFLDPGGFIGALNIWMIVTLLTTYCLYRIIESILPGESWKYYTLSTCIVMSVPTVLGTFSYFQPDAGTVCFFVFILYCYRFRKNILLFFSMMLLSQTKEVGIVILAGFGVGFFIDYIFCDNQGMKGKEKLIAFFKEPTCISGLLTLCMFFLWFIIRKRAGKGLWHYGHKSWADGFGLDLSFILFKGKEFFVANFNWLIYAGILICLIILRCRRIQRIDEQKNRHVLIPMFCSILTLAVFYSVYITFTHIRYQLLIDFGGAFFLVILLNKVFKTKKGGKGRIICYSILFCLTFLLVAEAYTTMDPVFIRTFQSHDTGSGKLISTNRYDEGIWGDYNVYNNQVDYLERAYELILRDVGYDEGMDVVTWDYNSYDILLSWDLPRFWDKEKKKITFKSGENTIPISGMVREQVEVNPEQCKSKVVYLSPEVFGVEESYEEDFLIQYHYRIRYRGFVSIPYGGKVRYIVCDRI